MSKQKKNENKPCENHYILMNPVSEAEAAEQPEIRKQQQRFN